MVPYDQNEAPCEPRKGEDPGERENRKRIRVLFPEHSLHAPPGLHGDEAAKKYRESRACREGWPQAETSFSRDANPR
jgi:hypothetical protein